MFKFKPSKEWLERALKIEEEADDISAGLPTHDLQGIAELFQQTAEDPNGETVVTHQGIKVTEI